MPVDHHSDPVQLQQCTHSSQHPQLWAAGSRPRNTEALARRERQRWQTVAAATPAVILTWFVLGQMPELNGLLARLTRILFILKPQSPGKQQVVAQRHSAGIRGLLDERKPFSVLSSGILAQGVGVSVCGSVCLSVPFPELSPRKGTLQSPSKQWLSRLGLGRGCRGNISIIPHHHSSLSLLD